MSHDDHRSDDYWKKALPRSLVIKMLRREQKRLYDRFAATFPPCQDWRVLDVGTNGSMTEARDYFLHYHYPYPERITAAGLEPPDTFRRVFPGCEYVQVRRGQPLPFADQSFDLVFSNAVIEHVGSRTDQQAFVLELARVGKRAFMTTPNRWHPIEFHTATPLIHYLPTPAYRRIYRALGFDFFSREENLNLLDDSTLRSLLPASVRGRTEIAAHRFLGIRSHLLLTLRDTAGPQ
ncbi:MAG: methyltransferase domain-containing protein [Vicinamibacterales bacterium]